MGLTSPRTIVVSRYNEDITWINNFVNDNVVVYNKGPNNIKCESIPLPNIGREAQTFLYHIINSYNNLTEETVFLQGNPFDHINNKSHSFYVNQLIPRNYDHTTLIWLGNDQTEYWNINNPHNIYPCPLIGWLLLRKEDIDNINALIPTLNWDYYKQIEFQFAPGAQYSVPKTLILNKPLTWWQKCYDHFMIDPDINAYKYERWWPNIWNHNL